MKTFALTLIVVAPFLLSCHSNPSSSAKEAPCNVDATEHASQATEFTSNASYVGACGFALNSVAAGAIGGAVTDSLFNGSQGCGTCYQLTGTAGTATIVVADSCPGCTDAHAFDLLDSTLQTLSGSSVPGIFDVTYKQVPCPNTGNIQVQIDGATNPYYLKARLLNHENPVLKLEVKVSGTYQVMTRTADNAFDITSGTVIDTPYSLRITDVYNQILEQSISGSAGNTVSGTDQFPTCS